MLRTVKPYVPLYRSCVCELVEAITPVMSRNPIGVHCGLLKGDLLPRGGLLCISHALLHKVASEIESGSDAELKPWLRMLLSIPCIFNSLPYEDLQYVLANSLHVSSRTNLKCGCHLYRTQWPKRRRQLIVPSEDGQVETRPWHTTRDGEFKQMRSVCDGDADHCLENRGARKISNLTRHHESPKHPEAVARFLGKEPDQCGSAPALAPFEDVFRAFHGPPSLHKMIQPGPATGINTA